MTADISAARAFLVSQGRLLDRHRSDLIMGEGDADPALRALEAHRNPDGGYGWSLEPDLRAPGSQPAGALHAFEVMAEAAPVTTPRAVELCDWLASVSLTDGGLPFALPIPDPTGTAPLWAEADTTTSSLQITCVVATVAHRVGRHDAAVARHPWLAAATRCCLEQIAAVERPETLFALVLRYALWLLDTVVDTEPRAADEMERLAAVIPPSGSLPVAGGAPDERMRPLDFTPLPGRPLRKLFAADAVSADLDRLADEQHADGGWDVDFASYSPGAARDWRSYMTVWALSVLKANGRV
jgi:hypothetical protein